MVAIIQASCGAYSDLERHLDLVQGASRFVGGTPARDQQAGAWFVKATETGASLRSLLPSAFSYRSVPP
jgi:hypothetical protein